MTDDTTRNQSDAPDDASAAELEVARQIEGAIGEATSIEAEMLEEAAELEEIAEAAVEAAADAIEIEEDLLDAGLVEEAAKVEEIAEAAVEVAADAVEVEAELLEEASGLEDVAEDLAASTEPRQEGTIYPPPADEVLAAIAAGFPGVRWEQVVTPSGPAQDEAHVATEALVSFVAGVRDAGYSTFIDLCAVDYLRRSPRFEVVIHLLDADRPHRLRIRVGADASDPAVPSITPVFPGANFYEREAYDLFGIDFAGHPDLSRILMPDEWEGHPLRKDYAVGSVPVQFKGSYKTT